MLRNKDGSVGVIFLVMQHDFSRVNNEKLMFSHEHSSLVSFELVKTETGSNTFKKHPKTLNMINI